MNNTTISARDSAILEFYAKPNTLQATGDKFGLTKEGVRQVAIKYDFLRKRGDADWIEGGQAHRIPLSKRRERVASFAWTRAEVDYIIANYGKISASKIGAKLGKTRNQVIGKANRMREIGIKFTCQTEEGA